ncbi:MAG: hypothetical protein QME66_01580 [Candidatus Eisenbacteria bacterium]|nr:hypothetical protein [Candidatus Eisenbacteria bacterium]
MTKLMDVVLLSLLAALLLLAGCYTVLKHPAASTISDVQPYGERCSDCHHAGIPGYHDPFYYGSYRYGWWSYYGRPWWYDYNYEPYRRGYQPTPPVTGQRHLWQDDSASKKSSARQMKSEDPSPAKDTQDQKTSKEKKEEKKRNLWKDK